MNIISLNYIKIAYLTVLFCSVTLLCYSQDGWSEKVTCGKEIEIGEEDDDDDKCYSWKANPEDAAVANLSSQKISVNPTKTTTYTRTAIGLDFSSVTKKEVKVVVLKEIKIKEVSYAKNIDVIKDNGSGAYPSPHWKDGALPQAPVCYKAGDVMELVAKIETDESMSPGLTIKVKGKGTNGYDIAPTTANYSGKQITVPATQISKGFPSQVDFIESFEIQWEVSFDNEKNWCPAGTSKNNLYVTLAAPVGGVTLFHTVIHLGCKNARGQSAATGVFANVWNEFKDRDVRRVDGARLTYYNNWTNVNVTTASLLQNSDGQCGSWAKLLLDILKTHGIDNSNEYVLVEYPAGDGFLVKNWNFTGAGTSGDPSFPYYNTFPNVLPSSYNFDFKEVTDATGIPGQGTANPSSLFNNHQFIRYNGRFYDPSYGTEAATILEMETNSIDGLFTVASKTIDESIVNIDLNGDGDKKDILVSSVLMVQKNPAGQELNATYYEY